MSTKNRFHCGTQGSRFKEGPSCGAFRSLTRSRSDVGGLSHGPGVVYTSSC